MLGMLFVIVAGFLFLVRNSYRIARSSAEPYRPEGKLRWGD